MGEEQIEATAVETPAAVIEAPKLSMNEEMKQAYEKQVEAADAPEVESSEEPEVTKEPAKEPAKEPEVEEEQTDEQKVESAVEKDFPLISNEMSAEEKEVFQGMLDSDDPDIQLGAELFLERYNQLKKGFYAKAQKFAEDTKKIKEVEAVFKPFKQTMEANGVSEAQYMSNMVVWEQSLTTDPVNTVKKIMQKFGVKPEQIGASDNLFDYEDDDDIITKRLDSLENENKSLKTQVANQPLQAQLESFKTATDPSGELKHPHFEEVAPVMGSLIQSGKAANLEKAYALAIRVMDESSEPSEPAVDVNKLREKVAKSKRAARGLKSTGGKLDYSKMSVRDELAARLKQ